MPSMAAVQAQAAWLRPQHGAWLARPRARRCLYLLLLRNKLGRRRWALGAQKKPYGKKWLLSKFNESKRETHNCR
jgi:hypothetical protein